MPKQYQISHEFKKWSVQNVIYESTVSQNLLVTDRYLLALQIVIARKGYVITKKLRKHLKTRCKHKTSLSK